MLTDESPVTVFFTDRPERIAGNKKPVAFIPFWSNGKAASNRSVKLLQGDLPTKGADVFVFIDIIGRLLRPFSFASAARRSRRRAY
jgi:hypothetical protein